MSFMLSCSSNSRFSIFRSLEDKENQDVNTGAVSAFTVDNLSKPSSSHNAQGGEVCGNPPPPLPHTHTHTHQTHAYMTLPMWVTLSDFQDLLCAHRSLLSLSNPVTQLSTWAFSPGLKSSSQALSDKEFNISGKMVKEFEMKLMCFYPRMYLNVWDEAPGCSYEQTHPVTCGLAVMCTMRT